VKTEWEGKERKSLSHPIPSPNEQFSLFLIPCKNIINREKTINKCVSCIILNYNI